MKDDNRRFRAVCQHLGMTPAEQIGFSEYVHDLKDSGEKGTANSRGDFTWDELVRHCQDYLEFVRR